MMNLIIHPSSAKPIYEQILDGLKREITCGNLRENEALPSIRNLAKDLGISVITTKRAYEELEREGYIYTVAGKGSYVAEKDAETERERARTEIAEHLKKAAYAAKNAGIGPDELAGMLSLAADSEGLGNKEEIK